MTLYHTGLLELPPLSTTTHLVILTAWAALFWGSIMGHLVVRSIGVPDPPVIHWELRAKTALIILSIAATAGTVVYAFEIAATFGWKSLVEVSSARRDLVTRNSGEFALRSLHSTILLGFHYAALALGGYLIGTGRGGRILPWIPALVMLVFSLIDASRARLVDTIVITTAVAFIGRTFQKPRLSMGRNGRSSTGSNVRLTLITVGLLATIFAMGQVLGKNESSLAESDSPLLGFLFQVIQRGTTPIAELDRTLSLRIENMYPGLATFAPGYWALDQLGVIDDYHRVSYFAQSSSTGYTAFITYSYLRWISDDFGLIGIVVAPFLLGLCSTALYIRALQGSIPAALLASLLSGALFYSIATWRFADIFFWLAIIIAGGTGIMISSSQFRIFILAARKAPEEPT